MIRKTFWGKKNPIFIVIVGDNSHFFFLVESDLIGDLGNNNLQNTMSGKAQWMIKKATLNCKLTVGFRCLLPDFKVS